MCCEESDDHLLAPAVSETLNRYEKLLAERGFDWGNELTESIKALRFVLNFCEPEAALQLWHGGELPQDPTQLLEALADLLPDPLPPGLALDLPSGMLVADPPPFVIPGTTLPCVVVTARTDGNGLILVEHKVDVSHPELSFAGRCVRAAEPTPAGRLRLVADGDSRWGVVDRRGTGWFPPEFLRKYDYCGRPYFHGNDLMVDAPVGRVTVSVSRGMEFRTAEIEVEITEGLESRVDLSPTRLYDPVARGWYGGDLHVHQNYSGDQVCRPEQARRMQIGEGLHLMNLVAANAATALIYDREAFESAVGEDVPPRRNDSVARWGVEYRNDLFGHMHALNPRRAPSRYQSGHVRSDVPHDWPPNATAAAEFRQTGATVGYAHPVFRKLPPDGSSAAVFDERRPRSMEARELVADAALGLVDSVDLLGPHDHTSTEQLYHRLLGCGLHLAATAGTDVMLSHSRGFTISNPPGWGRVYAQLGSNVLSVEAWQDAVRAGRTIATNGPWIELTVDGHGPGATLGRRSDTQVEIVASVTGLGARELRIIGPDGLLATCELAEGAEQTTLRTTAVLTNSIWVCASVVGDAHPAVLGPSVYAHTSPVWLEAGGVPVARPRDAWWCLDWLDRFETLAAAHGNFAEQAQRDDLIDVLNAARRFYLAITDSDGVS